MRNPSWAAHPRCIDHDGVPVALGRKPGNETQVGLREVFSTTASIFYAIKQRSELYSCSRFQRKNLRAAIVRGASEDTAACKKAQF